MVLAGRVPWNSSIIWQYLSWNGLIKVIEAFELASAKQ